jgi:hypothetical protein
MAQIISLGSSDTLGNSGVNGKVGINTTAAETPLHVVGAISVQNDNNVTSYIANSGTAKIYTTTSGGSYPFNVNGNLVIQPRTASGNGGDIVLATGKTTPSAKVVVLEGGNVGIATTTPSEKLEVSGNVKAGGGAYNNGHLFWVATIYGLTIAAN